MQKTFLSSMVPKQLKRAPLWVHVVYTVFISVSLAVTQYPFDNVSYVTKETVNME